MADVLEGMAPMPYARKRRLASEWLGLTIGGLAVMGIIAVILSRFGKFTVAAFLAGLVVGLFAAALTAIDLRVKARKGMTAQGQALIRVHKVPSTIALLILVLILVGFFMVRVLIDESLVVSFLCGVIYSWPLAVLMGLMLMETKFGKIYTVR